MRSIIALVGRPNVGKSTLFNRLSINKRAIVHDQPGVTRDRKYAPARLGPVEFTIVDTPGLEEAEQAAIEERMMGQAFTAVASADVVCLIVDGRAGVTPQDKFFAEMLRRMHSNVLLVVNKCEKISSLDKDYYKLGFGQPVGISAEHGIGMAELCEELLAKMPKDSDLPSDPFTNEILQIAVCGRPNAGKSTFINALIGEHRLLTGPEAGITRDSIDIDWEYKGQQIKLIDTAGLRKRGNVDNKLEQLSVADTLHTIRFANTVVLMIDANEGLSQQDLNIANYIINEGRSLVLAINKWDLIADKKTFREDFDYTLEHNLSSIKGVHVVFLSALNKQNISHVIDACLQIYKIWNTKISTAKLNQWLSYVTEHHQLPLLKNGRRIRLKYVTQTKIRPPSFKFFTNYPEEIPDSYKKYLINSIRQEFVMPGVPLRLAFHKTSNPYAGK